MFKQRQHTFATVVTALLAVGLFAPSAPQAEVVGTAAAVNADTFGTPPAANTRLIYLGTEVVFEERLETSANGSAQLLFLDQSTITIGPGSELVIDRYIYDPATQTGEIAISFGKGVLRFVGGKISKTEGGVTIRTPTADIGIRGGIGIVRQSEEGTRVIFVAGSEMSISSSSSPGIKITRVGGSANVSNDGDIVDTGLVSSEEVTQANSETQGNGSGGLQGSGPTNETANANLSNGLAENDQVLSEPQAFVGTEQRAAYGEAETGDGTPVQDDVIDSRQQQQQQQQRQQPPAVLLLSAGRLVATPESGYTDGYTNITNPLAQNVLGGPDARFDLGVSNARVENGRALGTTSAGEIDLPSVSGRFTILASDSTTPFGPASGAGFHDDTNGFSFYALQTSRTDFAQRIVAWGGDPTPDGGNSAGTGDLKFQAYILDPDPFRLGNIPMVPRDAANRFQNPTVTPVYVLQGADGLAGANQGSKLMQATLAIEGQGAAQDSLLYASVGEPLQTREGSKVYISQSGDGMVRFGATNKPARISSPLFSRGNAAGDHFFGPDRDYFVARHNGQNADGDLSFQSTNYSPFDTSVSTDGEGFTHLARRIDVPADLGTSRSTDRDLNGYAAIIGENRSLPPYLLSNTSDDPTSLRLVFGTARNSVGMTMSLENSNVVDAGINSVILAFGGTDTWSSAFLDDDVYAMRASNSTGYGQLGVSPGINGSPGQDNPGTNYRAGFRSVAVSGDSVPVTDVLPSGVSFCDCQFMEWGWWASRFSWDDDGPNRDRDDHMHLGSFIAGDLPDIGDLPADGTASFNGHAAGNVFNQGNQYVAVGNFAGDWDFANRSGSVNITSFDSANYSGVGVAAPLNGRDFSGAATNVTTPVGAVRIDINGSLFRAGSDPAGAMGGNFQITDEGSDGVDYRAIGTFVGE